MLFNSCTVEALCMRWLKRDIWKVGIALAGMLLLVLMVWVKVEAAGAYEGTSGLATPVTVHATPTVDVTATMTALQEDKLRLEIQQLKNQNEPDLPGWLRTNAAILLSTLVVVIGGLIGLFRWLADRRSEREKRVEERFQSAVTGLVDKKEEVRIGAAILLRTFLRPGYEQFYTQTFDLAVAHLRLPRTPHPSADPTTPLPLTTLSQALTLVFKEAFPLARQRRKERLLQRISRALLWLLQLVPASLRLRGSSRARMQIEKWFVLQSLDASKIQLDHAYLVEADLKQAWMVGASLRKASLSKADLSGASLNSTNLSKADLSGANLREATLFQADLSKVDLSKADLSGANLSHAELRAASLIEADLREAYLSGANLEAARYLEDTNLRGAKGLTKEQLQACKAKGAIVDEDIKTFHLEFVDGKGMIIVEDTTTSSPQETPPGVPFPLRAASIVKTVLAFLQTLVPTAVKRPLAESAPQSPVSPPATSPSSDGTQAPSVPSAQVSIPAPDTWYWKAYSMHGSTPPPQVSTPTPDTDGSSTTSSKPGDGTQVQFAPPVQESMPPSDTDGSAAFHST